MFPPQMPLLVDTLHDSCQHQGAEGEQAAETQDTQTAQHQSVSSVSLYRGLVIRDERNVNTSENEEDEDERRGDTLPMLCSSLEN